MPDDPKKSLEDSLKKVITVRQAMADVRTKLAKEREEAQDKAEAEKSAPSATSG
jgi:hypothetical protein